MTNRTTQTTPLARACLGALMIRLQGRGFTTELGRDSLTVRLPGDGQDARLIDTITCQPRPVDADRLWFFSGSGEPIEQADHTIDAAVIIARGSNGAPAPYGRMEALYDALRLKAPHICARCQHIPDTPEMRELTEPGDYLHLSAGRQCGRISWDAGAGTYAWSSGPDAGVRLPADVDEAAAQITRAFGDPTAEASG